jgi:hypothetical protein
METGEKINFNTPEGFNEIFPPGTRPSSGMRQNRIQKCTLMLENISSNEHRMNED